MKMGRSLVFLTLILIVCSCIERKLYATRNSREKVSKHISDQPPKSIKYPMDANFEDKVILLGYDLNKKEVRRGQRFKITWYWQCVDAPGPGWRLFTHLYDKRGKARLNRDRTGLVRRYFQPEYWEAGMVISDVQEVEVPLDWKAKGLSIRTGLWKGSRRMKGRGSSISDTNIAMGPRIAVKPAAALRAKVPYTAEAPVIDGKFEKEEVWDKAVQLESFKQTMTGARVEGATAVRLLWDDENLYIAMTANDDYLSSRYTQHDDKLWHEDAFEIFLDPKGDAKNYYELQVNPAGVVFDSFLPVYRKNQNTWTSHMVVQTRLIGKLNNDVDDKAWFAELAIPFSALHGEDVKPPKEGDKWRANFFRVNKTKKDKRYSAWSPPLRGDFHALDKFGHLIFVKEKRNPPQ